MDQINPSVTSLMMVRQHYLKQTSPEEMHQIDVQLTIMCARWNALDKIFRERYIQVEKNVGILQQFNDEISSLILFLTKVENQLNENKKDDVEKVTEKVLKRCFHSTRCDDIAAKVLKIELSSRILVISIKNRFSVFESLFTF